MTWSWNNDWREELKQDNPNCYERLCLGRNTKNDMKIIAKLIYKYNSSKSKKDCLDKAISWITDLNNQVNLVPDDEEYKKLLDSL